MKSVAELAHQFFVSLQLRVAIEVDRDALGCWMHLLFRRQHEAKFLSSFEKLGLTGLPHAVACARYHALSNAMGGVAVEYHEESAQKAWVRFRYPRWIHDGPALAAMPPEAGRGFLTGWYAQNGVSLGNPRLGYVCVSEDVSGYGLCGYFVEEAYDLSEDARLRFAPGEVPPPFDPADQPRPPAADWDAARLAKAERNYAAEYLRNGLPTLGEVLGQERMRQIALPAARLTGLQCWRKVVDAAGGEDGGPEGVAAVLAQLFAAAGDRVTLDGAQIETADMRLVRGMDAPARDDILAVWVEMIRGIVHGHRARMTLDVALHDHGATWQIGLADRPGMTPPQRKDPV
ncbi:MAG: hypothetical protein AAGK00_02120 [Pseudomonadota bacterium]